MTGQYGCDRDRVKAVQAIAPANSIWQIPSAARGRLERESTEPTPLPRPIPARKIARMMENVYTVAPRSSPNNRVQTTSAPSAHAPDSAIVA